MDAKLLSVALDDPVLFSAIHDSYPKELILAELKLLDKDAKETYRHLLLDLKGDRITSNHPPVVGDRVYVSPGSFRVEGEGLVKEDRGWGWARILEVWMDKHSRKFLQVVCASDVRLIIPFKKAPSSADLPGETHRSF